MPNRRHITSSLSEPSPDTTKLCDVPRLILCISEQARLWAKFSVDYTSFWEEFRSFLAHSALRGSELEKAGEKPTRVWGGEGWCRESGRDDQNWISLAHYQFFYSVWPVQVEWNPLRGKSNGQQIDRAAGHGAHAKTGLAPKWLVVIQRFQIVISRNIVNQMKARAVMVAVQCCWRFAIGLTPKLTALFILGDPKTWGVSDWFAGDSRSVVINTATRLGVKCSATKTRFSCWMILVLIVEAGNRLLSPNKTNLLRNHPQKNSVYDVFFSCLTAAGHTGQSPNLYDKVKHNEMSCCTFSGVCACLVNSGKTVATLHALLGFFDQIVPRATHFSCMK